MKVTDFTFDLPEELIAQDPLLDRSSSRLLVLDKVTGERQHRHFRDVKEYLKPGDCLVINDTKVIPARIYGKRIDTGATVEFLLLKDLGNDNWECLAGPGKKARVGHKFDFSGIMSAEVVEVYDNGNRVLNFSYEGMFYSLLDKVGQLPLPHYIHEIPEDYSRYQTVYANKEGSSAAPTAGLHFTPALLEKLKEIAQQFL